MTQIHCNSNGVVVFIDVMHAHGTYWASLGPGGGLILMTATLILIRIMKGCDGNS